MSTDLLAASSTATSVSLNIVTTLEKFGQTSLPVGFVAKVVGLSVGDVKRRLQSLADQGVVKIVDDSVSLVKETEMIPLAK